jgi:hypothetical protein
MDRRGGQPYPPRGAHDRALRLFTHGHPTSGGHATRRIGTAGQGMP